MCRCDVIFYSAHQHTFGYHSSVTLLIIMEISPPFLLRSGDKQLIISNEVEHPLLQWVGITGREGLPPTSSVPNSSF